jgi:outer membrane lipoprotein SlyB
MSMGASERRFEDSSPNLSKRSIQELGRYNLAAVYRTLANAEAAAADVRAAGVPERRIVVQDRRLTDEGATDRVVGPVSAQAPSTGEPVQTPTRKRDAEVVRVVFSRIVIWLVGATVVGAVVGLVIGLAFFGSATETWVAAIAGAVAGSVIGGMGGGIRGGMNQARREEGFLVEVHTDDPEEARMIAETLGRRGPIRLDRMAIDQGQGTA